MEMPDRTENLAGQGRRQWVHIGFPRVAVPKILSALGVDDGRRTGDPHGFAQKGGLFAIAFNKMNLGSRRSAPAHSK